MILHMIELDVEPALAADYLPWAGEHAQDMPGPPGAWGCRARRGLGEACCKQSDETFSRRALALCTASKRRREGPPRVRRERRGSAVANLQVADGQA